MKSKLKINNTKSYLIYTVDKFCGIQKPLQTHASFKTVQSLLIGKSVEVIVLFFKSGQLFIWN